MDKQALRARYRGAFAWLEARNVEPSDAFYARLDALRGQAWTVAKLATIEQIEQAKSSLIKALQSGQSFTEWQKALSPDMLALPRHYRETVFRNAVQVSYNGAKWAHFRDNLDRPILRYVAVNDSRTRPSHKALHGLMMPMDDPRWQTLAPSNGHGCRCTLMSLSDKQAKAFGYDGAPAELPTWTDKHGHDHVCQPDKGWAHSPENQDLTALLREREQKAGLSQAVYNGNSPKTAEDDLRKQAENAASILLSRATEQEGRITGDLTKIASGLSIYLAGLEYRIKSQASLSRKILTKMTAKNITAIAAAETIDDALRYTFLLSEDEFVVKFHRAIARMQALGHKIISISNTWRQGAPYKGINTVFERAGQRYELQFHTQQSFDLKNGKLHELYERFRAIGVEPTEKESLWREMVRLSDVIPQPEDIDSIRSKS